MDDWQQRPFIKGLDLSQMLFTEGVQPLLGRHFPRLPYAAARLDGGSDVLGFDTPQSRDHDWGPRLTLFLTGDDLAAYGPAIDQMLRQSLPREIMGYPTHFAHHPDGTTHLQTSPSGPINHGIDRQTIAAFFAAYLGHSLTQPLQPTDWLTFPEQRLRTIRHGRIFYDGLGGVPTQRGLTAVRQQLHYYPHDLWLYLLAGQWQRLDQEEPFVGRCGDVGDELGSRLIATRQVQNLMHLSFLLEQEYIPYPKWFGTAFARLGCAPQLTPLLEQVWQAPAWPTRQQALATAYEWLARRHNQLGLTEPVPDKVGYFHERPYLVIHAGNFVQALRAQIRDEAVLALPNQLGNVDQLFDSTDILSYPQRFRQAGVLFNAISPETP